MCRVALETRLYGRQDRSRFSKWKEGMQVEERGRRGPRAVVRLPACFVEGEMMLHVVWRSLSETAEHFLLRL